MLTTDQERVLVRTKDLEITRRVEALLASFPAHLSEQWKTLEINFPPRAAYRLMKIQVGELTLRPFRYSDASMWRYLRELDQAVIQRREALPYGSVFVDPPFTQWLRMGRQAMRQGTAITLAITWKNMVIGYVSANPLWRGAVNQTTVGYWVASPYSCRGVAGLALAALLDFLHTELLFNRVEVLIEPNNVPSLRLVKRLNLANEGLRARALCIENVYRDHLVFVSLAENLPVAGFVEEWFGSYRGL